MDKCEQVMWQGKTLAFIIRDGTSPERTEFLTPPELNLQVGFVVYPAEGEIIRHVHNPIERQTAGTSEVLLVKKGRCLVDIYSHLQEFVATHELHTGDLLFVVEGGHGFRMLEDTVLLEVKQGPYAGVTEKKRF